MSANLRSRCALMDKHRGHERRLSVESLENRRLMAAVETPAAVDADSLAQAVAASSPGLPTSAPSAPTAASRASNAAFIGNVYQELLGRAPAPTDIQNWQNYLTVYSASSVNSRPGELGGTAAAIPLVESPSNNFASATVSTGPNSGSQIGIQEFNYGSSQGTSSQNNDTGTALTTGGTSSGISGGIARNTPIPATDQASLGTTGTLAGSSGQTANDPGRLAFVESVLASPEYRQRVVNEIYQNFLHRSPDNQALGYWTQQLASNGERGIIDEILASPEYFNNAGATGQGYINALYRDLLGRDPSAADQQFWMSQLASDGGDGAARGMVASRILSSPEASGELVDGSANSALANLTNGGYNQLFFQGGLNAAEQQSYFAGLENNLAFEDVLASMVVGDRYFRAEAGATGPGPGNNPGLTAGRPG